MRYLLRLSAMLGLLALTIGCGATTPTSVPAAAPAPTNPITPTEVPPTPQGFTLNSSVFAPSGAIPAKYTCSDQNISPPLAWGEPPANTQSFALIVEDPDAGGYVHWVIYNIPATARGLAEALPQDELLPDGSSQGQGSDGAQGYFGPCPPSGNHRYTFTLYALDTQLQLEPPIRRLKVATAMKDHILAQTSLEGTYQK